LERGTPFAEGSIPKLSKVRTDPCYGENCQARAGF
jgi:hypothetical protein